ncbi:MAG: DUF1501 domain-containing protein, partial [Planctomycetales bacterium]|nr:DUF1501 domain-containing protein [Planctomycetales bacterium]
FPTKLRDCERAGRRQFLLEVGSLAPLGLSLPLLLQAQSRANAATHEAKETNCILVWPRGGTSHHDTFDPKPEAAADVRGEFGVIDTAIPGVKFTEHVPTFAKELNRFALLRNLNPRNGSHGTADAIMMSGHKFNPAITYPCFGSVVAKEHGPRGVMPPFMQIGTQVDRRFGGGLAGYLGIAHNAFELPGDPNAENFTVRDITPPSGVSLERLARRQAALERIDRFQADVSQPADSLTAISDYYEHAFSMITSPETQRAFELSQEDTALRDRYGRHTFGQSCLLARRLVESGVRFVTVTSGGWDTHSNNFDGLKKLLPPVDQGLPMLLEDLEQRGLLDTTLVVWLTDFGRTPKINSAAGRDHWSTAGFAIFAGAGVQGGAVIGATDDEGAKPVDAEYYPSDIAATIYAKLGIPLDKIHIAPDGRPMRLCEGRPIPELMG